MTPRKTEHSTRPFSRYAGAPMTAKPLMPDLKVDIVDISTLVPDPKNPRTQGEANLKAVIKSIKTWGQVEALVVGRGDNKVIGGNCRLDALKALGYKQAAVHYVDLDDDNAKALAIALNRTGELAGWDDDQLAADLESLDEELRDAAYADYSLEADEMPPPDLPTGDKGEFMQMTFTLHESQAEEIRRAMEIAAKLGPFADLNENRNGNALARVAERFVAHYG